MPKRPFKSVNAFCIGILVLALFKGSVVFSDEAEFKNLSARELKQLLDGDKKVVYNT